VEGREYVIALLPFTHALSAEGLEKRVIDELPDRHLPQVSVFDIEDYHLCEDYLHERY